MRVQVDGHAADLSVSAQAPDAAATHAAVEICAKWNGKVLRREIETKESLKVVEDYTVSADGKQLIVTVKTSNIMVRMQNVEITRRYDRVQ